jgi:F0F1-type ATP synthase membrane subunit b/b'
VLDSSRDEAQNQVNDAKKELAEASDRAVRELEGQAEALARSLASRILGRDVA